jgi:uncharacterized YccA/Bax inhibitor family protein
MPKTAHLVLALVVIAAFITTGYVFGGFIPAMVFTVASVGGFVLWLRTTWKTPVDPYKLIIPYLLTVIFFIGHVYEEYLTDFEVAMTDITGFHIAEQSLLTIAAFVAPIMWLTGAILLLKRLPIGYYFLSFFFVAMMIAELSHFIFPFLEDGTFHYVSGMYTAAIPLFPAAWGFSIVIREIRRTRAEKG